MPSSSHVRRWFLCVLGLSLAIRSVIGQDSSTGEDQFEIPQHEKPFWESAQVFADAYAKRDANAIGMMFTENAEFLDELGVSSSGRDEIVARFQEAFSLSPEASIEEININRVRMISGSVAIEEGTVVSSESIGGPRFPVPTPPFTKRATMASGA